MKRRSFIAVLTAMVLLGFLFCPLSVISSEKNDSWLSVIKADIQQSEYEFEFDKKSGQYLASNRAQQLHFSYTESGFRVVPWKKHEQWKILLSLCSFGKDGALKKYNGAALSVDKNSAIAKNEHLAIQYLNNTTGMRQNFIIYKKPDAPGNLFINLNILTDLSFKIKPDKKGAAFYNADDNIQYFYEDLIVYDSAGNLLPCRMEKRDEHTLSIIVADAGAVYPITIDPLSSTPDWSTSSDQEDAFYGRSVSTAGDVNNDGYDDVIVGAPNYSNGQENEGLVYVYHGSSSGLSTTPDWSGEHNVSDEHFGYHVAAAGDVNNDGYDDVIIGTNWENTRGRAYVILGSANGLKVAAQWIGFGEKTDCRYGNSVSGAGDVNGDGYDDFIVGAPFMGAGSSRRGAIYLYYGSGAASIPQFHSWAFYMPENNMFDGARLGHDVACAGDINNDGYDDIIAGAPGGDVLGTKGEIFVFYGSSQGPPQSGFSWSVEGPHIQSLFGVSVSTAGDVNGDGYDDIIVGSAWTHANSGANAYVYHGSSSGFSYSPADWTFEEPEGQFGSSVSSIGDVNNDGYDDVIIGQYDVDMIATKVGRVHVFSGSASGLAAEADWDWNGGLAGQMAGFSVSGAGDVNGDGYDDFIVGGPNFSDYWPNANNTGRAFAFFGSSGFFPVLTVLNVWWEDEVDEDGDGYVQSARLMWTAQVLQDDPLFVYDLIWYKKAADANWEDRISAGAHDLYPVPETRSKTITSSEIGVTQQELMDFKIRMGLNFMSNMTPYWEFGPDLFNVLDDYKMEPVSEDEVTPTGPTWFHVTEPNGGEVWYVGTRYQIKWESDSYTGEVMVEISTNGGQSWWDITQGQYTANDGLHSYVPNSSNVSENCMFRVRYVDDTSIKDCSDNVFAIRETTPSTVNITFNVSVPSITPGRDTVYIAGNFNEWDPGPAESGTDGQEHDLPMVSTGDHTWQLTMTANSGDELQYKYTSGSWQTVEKGIEGAEITNRILNVPGQDWVQNDVVICWADLPCLENMLINNDFSNGDFGWAFTSFPPSTADYSIDNEEFVVNITNGGTELWHVQLNQYNLNIVTGKQYRVIFDGYASDSRTLNTAVGKNTEPWTFYSGYETIELSTEKKRYSYIFTMNEPTDPDSRIFFDLGLSAVNVTLDNIILMQLSSAGFWADVDDDGDVDIIDIQLVAARWNTSQGDPNYDAKYDLDNNGQGDGDIDVIDIQLVASWWNKPLPPGMDF